MREYSAISLCLPEIMMCMAQKTQQILLSQVITEFVEFTTISSAAREFTAISRAVAVSQ
jgi:hypothetical protein